MGVVLGLAALVDGLVVGGIEMVYLVLIWFTLPYVDGLLSVVVLGLVAISRRAMDTISTAGSGRK